MPVTDKHRLYDQSKVRVMRACIKGEDAVKALGTKVLPKPSGIRMAELTGTDEEKTLAAADWQAYKFRAEYHDLVGPTQDGLVSLAFGNDWIFDMPDRLKTFMEEKATPDGKTLLQLAEYVLRENTVTARVGLFSDMVDKRPCIVPYVSETITNWRDSDNKMVVLQESKDIEGTDRFKTTTETNFRELRLDEGRYRVITHQSTPNNTFVETEIAQGLQVGEIPFVFTGSQSLDATPDDFIPLWPLAKKLLKAYEVSPDFYQTMHYTAQPILFLRGFGDDVPNVAGATTTIATDADNADGKYIEFTGAGAEMMMKVIEAKLAEAMMFTHYLHEKGSSVESGSALSIRVGAQTASLKAVVINTAAAIEQALKYCAQWISADPEQVKVTPNLDFVDADVDAAILKVLGEQVALGVLPIEVYQAYQRQVKLTDLIDEDIAKLLEAQAERMEAASVGFGNSPDDQDEAA